jgi:hypothetical protein
VQQRNLQHFQHYIQFVRNETGLLYIPKHSFLYLKHFYSRYTNMSEIKDNVEAQETLNNKNIGNTTSIGTLSEEALAEQSKKLPFILSSTRKQQHHHTLSNSSSFDDTSGELFVVENEYGQLPPPRIHGIHKKGTPTQHRILHSGGSTSTSSSVGVNTNTFLDGSAVTSIGTIGGGVVGVVIGVGGASTPRSRSRSPSIGRTGGAVAATITTNNTAIPTMMNSVVTDGNSSISSMDDYECDLFTDRAGVMDELSESQRKLHSSKDLHLPATVLERMSEDSLEDNHAFTDLVRTTSSRNRDREEGNFSSNASRVSHVSGSNAGDGMLEPLDECDEGLENDSLEDSVTDQNYYNIANGDDVNATSASGQFIGGETNGSDPNGALIPTTTVILTNMENLTLESANNDYIRQQQGYNSQAGSVSAFSSVGGVAGNATTTNTATGDTTTGTVGSTSLPLDSAEK